MKIDGPVQHIGRNAAGVETGANSSAKPKSSTEVAHPQNTPDGHGVGGPAFSQGVAQPAERVPWEHEAGRAIRPALTTLVCSVLHLDCDGNRVECPGYP